jgi:hypothetical protein
LLLFVSAILGGLYLQIKFLLLFLICVFVHHEASIMERPAYKLNEKARLEQRIYINKEALIYSGCGSKEAHSQICDSLFAASDNEVYVVNRKKLIKVSFNDEEVSTGQGK